VSAVVPEDEASPVPRSGRGARTRLRLLEAAKEIFEENGFLNARVTDIAERAGFSHGAFYHYFDSKEQIFREVAETLDDQLSEPMASVIFARGAAGGPRERYYTALHRHLEQYRSEARMMGVIEQVARYDEYVAGVRAVRNREHREEMEASVRRLQQRGRADRALNPEITAAALGSMVERFAEMWLAQGQLDCDLDEAAETLARLFVNALQLRDPGTT
jgi:AcrR family transcriptional regulator